MYRGLIHFHSKYSYDSNLSIERIVNFALKNKLNFLVLTDHDTIKGSIELKKYIEINNYDIEVIISSEYYTQYGDIIACGIETEIEDMQFDNFIKEVKNQNGILLFPHPYKGHSNIEYIAKNVDLIEVFNARTDDISNEKALFLADKYKKNKYYATDSHNYMSLKNCIIEFDKRNNFLEALKYNKIIVHKKLKSYHLEVFYSQYIKLLKVKKLRLFLSLIKFILLKSIKFTIFKRI